MSRGLLDANEFAVSIVTLAELQIGVLTAKDVFLQGKRMKTYRQALQFNPIEIDQQIADA